MATTTEPVVPIIHLNGTSATQLIEALNGFYEKLSEAYEALRECAPNGRDFYVGPADMLERAIEQHGRRQRTIDDMKREIELEIIGIESQQRSR